MAVHSILPETSLKNEDVRDTLNANGGSVSNYLPTFFTASANINMWSLKKPVRNNVDFPTGEWWKADNCGLGTQSVQHPTQLANVINGGLNGWHYRLPRGGAYNEPYRLGDFRGYAPNAARMVDGLIVPNKVQKGTTMIIEAVVTQPGSDSVTVADLGLSGCYFGAYIVGSGSNCIKTSASPLNTLSTSVSFDTSNFGTGDHKVYVFLSTSPITTQTTTLVNSTYYTIPNTGIGTVNITSAAVTGPQITGEGWVEPNSTIAKYSFTISKGTQGQTITNAVVKFRFAGKGYSDTLVEGETQVSLGNIGTIGSSLKFTYSNQATLKQAMVNRAECYMWVYCRVGNTCDLTLGPVEVAFEQPE